MSSLIPNLSRYETSVLNYAQPRAIDLLCLESAVVNLTHMIIAMATPCVEISSDRYAVLLSSRAKNSLVWSGTNAAFMVYLCRLYLHIYTCLIGQASKLYFIVSLSSLLAFGMDLLNFLGNRWGYFWNGNGN